jgi:F-box/leucine-rich repeat protein 10/11
MGMKDSWTDWHVDFAASSVYYSVHTGRKVFFFVRPTEANLAAYAQWSGSDELQASTWLPDMCDGVRKVTLEAGDTMIIPAGYIHAVFTPVDSIVFGGNFVHSYDIPTQLRLRQIEIDTKVPQRFRFPFFDRLCWHVARRSTADLRALREYRPTKENSGSLPPDRVLRGLVALARFLIAETERMESPATEDKIRKLVYGRIPPEVADPAALAHELLWRAERELPAGWEEEEAEVRIDTKGAKGKKRKNGATTPASAATTKRARAELPAAAAAVAASVHDCAQVQWESEEHKPVCEAENVMLPRPVNREGDEYAKQVTTTHRQTRRRVREEEDSGGPVLILEEHELVFTERQVTWLLPDSS